MKNFLRGFAWAMVLVGLFSGVYALSQTIYYFNGIGATATYDGGYFAALTMEGATGISQGVTATTLPLIGKAAVGGAGVTLSNAGDETGTGWIMELVANSANQFAISGRGHLIPQSTAPTAPLTGVFASGFGTVTAITLTGGDASMLLKFSTGTGVGQITEQTSLIGTITLSQQYSGVLHNVFAAYATEPTNASLVYGSNDEAPLVGVVTGASTFTLYSVIPFSPHATQPYAISIQTYGAGDTY